MPGLPRPTLFPYTTLFRSRQRLRSILREKCAGAHSAARRLLPLGDERIATDLCRPEMLCNDGDAGLRRNDLLEDRKSTRLNSSHVAISYAVFCVKKKTSQR